MLGQEVPRPRYWKALAAALLIWVPAGFLSHAVFPHTPLWPWILGFACFALMTAFLVHRHAVNNYDGDPVWQMNYAQQYTSTRVGPDVNVRKQ